MAKMMEEFHVLEILMETDVIVVQVTYGLMNILIVNMIDGLMDMIMMAMIH
jgi:hypothetical protein